MPWAFLNPVTVWNFPSPRIPHSLKLQPYTPHLHNSQSCHYMEISTQLMVERSNRLLKEEEPWQHVIFPNFHPSVVGNWVYFGTISFILTIILLLLLRFNKQKFLDVYFTPRNRHFLMTALDCVQMKCSDFTTLISVFFL